MNRAVARQAKRVDDYLMGRADGRMTAKRPRRMTRAYWVGYQLGLQYAVERVLAGR